MAMQIQFSSEFDRQFNTRLTGLQKIQTLEALSLFIDDAYHKDLRNHELRSEWKGYRSISIGGDLRLHFKMLNNKFAYFVALGSHDELYR
jgi:addiction module RelE/StbE family toxin